MAMALLQPQQQQQQEERNWFFIDFEDDGGLYEVEVDLVGVSVCVVSPKCSSLPYKNYNFSNDDRIV